jgi:hypothetical protein
MKKLIYRGGAKMKKNVEMCCGFFLLICFLFKINYYICTVEALPTG